MLAILRAIVQEVTAAPNLELALTTIVQRVKLALAVDVCSIYLTDRDTGELVLLATDGLLPESVGQVRLSFASGLVGLVAERAEPVNLADAPQHPRYRYFPETGEERYHAFLGVPIIHHRELLGVLVVQRHAEDKFDEDVVTLLVTIAAQLAGAIAHAEASGGIDGLQRKVGYDGRPLEGIAGAPGVAIGEAVVVHPYAEIEGIPDREVDDPKVEERRFLDAVEAVRQEMHQMLENVRGALQAGDRALFDAFLMMLDGESLTGAVVERIRAGNWAPGALRQVVSSHMRAFRGMSDPYLRERAEDVGDLGRRILQHLEQVRVSAKDYPRNTVLVGEEITASMLAEVPLKRLAGVIAVRGSRTSHTAILARALGVPAVLGVEDLSVARVDGKEVIADGYSGRVFVAPSNEVRREFRRLQREEKELTEELRSLRELPAETPDGLRVPLYANTGLLSDIRPSLNSGAEGIGLYRTEFPFMIRERFPGEEEQRLVYRQVLESFAPRPVVMRTLDVGGDKALPYFPIKEDNPFLGWRGIRITLDHPELFLVQIRAMLRANIGLGNLDLLLPMVATVGEVDEAKTLIQQAYHELLEEGEAVTMPKLGVMVEVPSIIYQVGALAQRVDFLSIGSNDLTQYLLAVDRNNSRVAELYDSLHPAVVAAIRQIVSAAREHRIPVSVCGEIAGDPMGALLLIAMGVSSLSMSASSLPRVKWVVRSFTRPQVRRALQKVSELESPAAVRETLRKVLDRGGLGGLVRAGK